MAQKLSVKHLLIDKANTTIVAVTAGAAFVVIFCLVASQALIGQAGYQNRIISAKRKTLSQIQADISASKDLESSYAAFVGTPQNLIGGNPGGTGNRDGDNAKIVLDALPAQYDFPALATSLEQLITSQNLTIGSIAGTDDQLAQQTNQNSASPQSVAMPFQISVQGNYQGIQSLVSTFENSIRPFEFQTMELSGSQNALTMTITAQTFYQPSKTLTITNEVIK